MPSGINGQKIELVFGDDVSDPKQGVSVANRLVGRWRQVRHRPLPCSQEFHSHVAGALRIWGISVTCSSRTNSSPTILRKPNKPWLLVAIPNRRK